MSAGRELALVVDAVLSSPVSVTELEKMAAVIDAWLEERDAHSCGTCGGTPHPSGRVCVCGGTGDSRDEARGLRLVLVERDQVAAATSPVLEIWAYGSETLLARIGWDTVPQILYADPLIAPSVRKWTEEGLMEIVGDEDCPTRYTSPRNRNFLRRLHDYLKRTSIFAVRFETENSGLTQIEKEP